MGRWEVNWGLVIACFLVLSVVSYSWKEQRPGKLNCRGAVAMVTPLVRYWSCLQGVSEVGDWRGWGGGQILCVNYSIVNNSMCLQWGLRKLRVETERKHTQTHRYPAYKPKNTVKIQIHIYQCANTNIPMCPVIQTDISHTHWSKKPKWNTLFRLYIKLLIGLTTTDTTYSTSTEMCFWWTFVPNTFFNKEYNLWNKFSCFTCGSQPDNTTHSVADLTSSSWVCLHPHREKKGFPIIVFITLHWVPAVLSVLMI